MIQINPLQSYIDGGARAAIVSPPSASLVFDLPGKAIWVKGVKLKGTDHTYTFSHDTYISITNTPGSNESEDIKIGINTTLLKLAIDTTYGVVSASVDGLAPKFSNANKATASAATTYNFLGIAGSTLKWYQLPWRNIRINTESTDVLGVNSTDPLIISSGDGIEVTWDSTNKRIVITNSKPHVFDNTDFQVSQIITSTNNDYRVLLKRNANNDDETGTVRYASTLLYNPSTKILKVNGNRVVTFADLYVGATSSAAGTEGLVPAASSANRNKFLRGDGTWQTPTNDNTWRPVKVEGTQKLASTTDTDALDFHGDTGIEITYDATNKKINIKNTKPDVNHNTHYTTTMYVGENNDTAANKAVNSNPYLKLFDDAARRSTLRFVAGTGITIKSDASGNITITNASPDVNHNTDKTGVKLGTVTGSKKIDDTLIITNSSSGLVFQGGTNKFSIGDGTNYIEVPVTPTITVTNKSANILTSLTTLATIDGTDIKAKITVEDKAATIGTSATTIATIGGTNITAKIGSYAASSHTHSVKINGSEKTIAAPGGAAIDLGSYLPLAGGTMTGNIGMGGDSTKFLISSGTSGANSPLRGTKMPATSSNWIGLFARPSKATDEGGILLSEDTCVIYNSHDTGWGFLVVDTDLSQSDWSADSAKAFGVNSAHLAWALGGFVKAGSDDTYVLLGGGGHKDLSDFSMSGHSHYNILPLGDKNASDLPSTYLDGLSMHSISYNHGWPFDYGCGITSVDIRKGAFQIAGQWTTSVTSLTNYDFPTEMYIRARRDNYDVWTTWTRVLTNRNWSSVITLPTKSSWNYDDVYLKLSGGNMTGAINMASVSGYALHFNNSGSGHIGITYGALCLKIKNIDASDNVITNNIDLYLGSNENKVLHTGNTSISNGIITINGTSITPLTSASGNFWGNSWSNGGTVSGNFTMSTGDQINMTGELWDGFAFNYYSHSSKTNGLAIRFYNGKLVEIVRFLANGNVGIGTSSPATKLHVNGNTRINFTSGYGTYYYGYGESSVEFFTKASGATTYTSKGVVGAYTDSVFMYNRARGNTLRYYDNGTLLFEGHTLWHDANDGSGSGLDADLLDGYHASSFSLVGHTHNYITSLGNYTPTTTDNRSSYGVYTYNIYSGSPQLFMSVIGFGSGMSKVEIAGSWGDDYTGYLYWRSKSDRDINSYPWKSWKVIIDSDNIGSQSVNYASSAGTATNLTNAPSMLISGNTIAVKSGEKTSNYITVPYATSAGNADTLDGYHEDSFFRYRGELYQNNGHNANTLKIGSWIFRSSGYGNVGSGAAHANALSENSTIEVFQNLQLSTSAWSNSVSYRVRWGSETNSTRPNAWSSWYTFLSNENYTSYVNPRATSKTIYGGTYIDANGNFQNYSGNLNMTTGDLMNFQDPNNDGVAFNYYNGGKSTNSSIRIYNGRYGEWARFNQSGYFGIGTSSPSQRLHVSGNTRVDFTSGYGTYYYGPASESSIEFFNNGTRKAVFGSYSNCAFIWNANRSNTLRYNDNGTLTFEGYTVWHSGNDGSGSGLDADLLDGTHKADLLTAASLGASGNSTTISVTVGGTTKTGSVTVPYATNSDTVDGYHASALNTWKDQITGTALTWSQESHGCKTYSHYTGNPLGSYRQLVVFKNESGSTGLMFNAFWCVNPTDSAASNNIYFRVKRDAASDWGPYTKLILGDGNQTINGNLTCTNFYTTSDRTKKQNISSFSEHIRKFQLKDTEKWHYGVIAQEVDEMFRDGEEGNMTVNYNSILSFYIGSLENSVAGLEDAKRQLENKVKMLEERVKRLESK